MSTSNQNIVQLADLSIGYEKPLISNINAEIFKGDIILLAGKNGAGKTTLLKTIFKEITPLTGSILINTTNLSKIPLSEIGRMVAVVFSKSIISPALKVFDLVALGRYPYKKWYQKLSKNETQDINRILDLLGLNRYRDYYVNELSDGNLQKTLIARALIQDTPLLILDEPTSHLDISNKLEVMKIVRFLAKEKGKTILFTSHDLALGLTIADKIWMIKNNSLIKGFTEDLAHKEDILNFFAGKSVKFDYHTNEYEFIPQITEKEVSLEGDIESLYWLRKALIRNSFSIKKNASLIITEKNSNYIVSTKNDKIYTFLSIQETIDFLNSQFKD